MIRETVTEAAHTWIGTPYRHQASLKGVGCDCLGLVRGVWRDVYRAEPEMPPAYSRDWAEALGEETLRDAAARHMLPVAKDDAAPGDLLLFAVNDQAPAKHCAILTAPGRMIHAWEGHPVAEVSFSGWWLRRLKFVFAFPDQPDSEDDPTIA